MPANKDISTGAANAPTGKGVDVSRAKAPTVLSPVMDSPFEFVRRFAEQMDHIFDDFTGGRGFPAMFRTQAPTRRDGGHATAGFCPPITIHERDGNLMIRADMPGLTKDDVKVDLADGMLTIEGERKEHKEEKGEGVYYNECCYGGFSRSVPLPEGVDVSAAKAKFQNGVLEVSVPLPKQAKKETRRLEIHDA